jgi:thymidylate synthase
MNKSYPCDTFFDQSLIERYVVKSVNNGYEFKHIVLSRMPHVDHIYADIVNRIVCDGSKRTGRNGDTLSKFVEHMKLDLRDGFPVLSTKKVFFKGIVEECLFFLNGRTNSKMLEWKGVNIWRGNTSRDNLDTLGFVERPEGEMGPMYGAQWRNFMAPCDEKTGQRIGQGVDQLASVIETIKNNPTSRRIIMTDYNPAQVHLGVLPPCHSIVLHFYVDTEYLDVFCYNRSSDIGLGLPFNIASTALVTSIVAKITNLTPRFLHMSLGDAHIYEQHIDALTEQIKRRSYAMPNIVLPNINNLSELEDLTSDDFKLEGYKSGPSVKMEMVV